MIKLNFWQKLLLYCIHIYLLVFLLLILMLLWVCFLSLLLNNNNKILKKFFFYFLRWIFFVFFGCVKNLFVWRRKIKNFPYHFIFHATYYAAFMLLLPLESFFLQSILLYPIFVFGWRKIPYGVSILVFPLGKICEIIYFPFFFPLLFK